MKIRCSTIHDPRMYSKDGYWFLTKHGLGPGTVPSDVEILDVVEDDNWNTWIKLNRFLTTEELNYYDLEESSPEISNSTAVKVGEDEDFISYEITAADNIGKSEDDEEEHKYDDDDIQEIDQEFSSKDTAINGKQGKLPAIFKMIKFNGGLNLDYGGGTEESEQVAQDYLDQFDTQEAVYDPYNQTKEHNSEVKKLCRQNGGADYCTCSNVLNVIKESSVRLNILNNIKKLMKTGCPVYITVYEGDSAKGETVTQKGRSYQLNRKTKEYLEEIQQVFPDATIKGKLITAHSGSSTPVKSSTDIPWYEPYYYEHKYGEPAEDDVEDIEIYIDTTIYVDENGWDYQDTDWMYQKPGSDDWIGKYKETIDDAVGVQEKVDDLISDYIPIEFGTYKLTANVILHYEITGLYYEESNNIRQDSLMDTYYDKENSSIEDISVDKMSIQASMTDAEVENAILNNKPFDIESFKRFRNKNNGMEDAILAKDVEEGENITIDYDASELDIGTEVKILRILPPETYRGVKLGDITFEVMIKSIPPRGGITFEDGTEMTEGSIVNIHYDMDDPVGTMTK